MKKYTVDILNTKTKRVIDLNLLPMNYTQAITFRSKMTYYKHYDYRIRKII